VNQTGEDSWVRCFDVFASNFGGFMLDELRNFNCGCVNITSKYHVITSNSIS
jgi:hypothetical protein